MCFEKQITQSLVGTAHGVYINSFRIRRGCTRYYTNNDDDNNNIIMRIVAAATCCTVVSLCCFARQKHTFFQSVIFYYFPLLFFLASWTGDNTSRNHDDCAAATKMGNPVGSGKTHIKSSCLSIYVVLRQVEDSKLSSVSLTVNYMESTLHGC